MRCITFAALAILVATAISATSQDAMNPTLTGIPGVYLQVQVAGQEAEAKGITPDGVSAEVERRLRQAGVEIYDSASVTTVQGSPTLFVDVIVLPDRIAERAVYYVRVEFAQAVKLARSEDGEPFLATTWSAGGLGEHGIGWRQALIDAALAYTDEFIAAFQSANYTGE